MSTSAKSNVLSLLGWLVRAIRDRIDEGLARRLRTTNGPSGCLLSWQPEPGRGWRSRLSCPELARTVERVGKTRVEAIQSTLRARERIVTLRTAIEFGWMQTAEHDC